MTKIELKSEIKRSVMQQYVHSFVRKKFVLSLSQFLPVNCVYPLGEDKFLPKADGLGELATISGGG